LFNGALRVSRIKDLLNIKSGAKILAPVTAIGEKNLEVKQLKFIIEQAYTHTTTHTHTHTHTHTMSQGSKGLSLFSNFIPAIAGSIPAQSTHPFQFLQYKRI